MANRDKKKQQEEQQDNLRAKLRWGIVGIVVLLVITSFFVAPGYGNRVIRAINTTGIGIPEVPEKEFQLGLDLQGGAHLVYQADITAVDPAERAQAVEGVRDVIERLVNSIGVG